MSEQRIKEILNDYMGSDGVSDCWAELKPLIDTTTTAQFSDWMLANSFSTGHGDTFADLLKELTWQVAELRQAARHDDAAQEEAAMLAHDMKPIDIQLRNITNAIALGRETGDLPGTLDVIERAVKELEGK